MRTEVTERMERRMFAVGGLAARGASGEKRSLAGHAAVFNQIADLGGFREVVAPGAFTNSIANDDIRALFNHDANYVLGRNTAKTLRLVEDGQGLAIEIDPPDTQFARDLAISIERGDITQMSFGFETVKDEWQKDTTGMWTRTLREAKLWDVSPVTFPAYPTTDIGARSLEAYKVSIPPAAVPLGIYLRNQQLLESIVG